MNHKEPWNKGKKLPKEMKEKISNSLKGKSNSFYGKKHNEETKEKISNSLKGENNSFYGKTHSEEKKKQIAQSVKGNKKTKVPESIMDVSTRTTTKILQRLNIGCSRCGWNEANCDIHHINGRKIEDANNHNNLCLLCPNCHRLVHNNKIKKEELTTLVEQIGDKWKEYYYWN